MQTIPNVIGTSAAGRTGVWLLGALGEIATTVVVGAHAVGREIAPGSGMVSALPPMSGLGLARLNDMVFGGLDIRPGSVPQTAEQVSRRSRTFSPEVVEALAAELSAIDRDVVIDAEASWRPAAPARALPPLNVLVARLRGYLAAFRARHDLRHVVVVNLTSAEPAPVDAPAHEDLSALEAAIAADRKDIITPSMCAAYAAFMEGSSYVNFTPNDRATCPALSELAEMRRLPFCGNDGKTGETLVKTALAPMFAYRNLSVLSWEGINLLGNGDGATLDVPENRAAKLRNKGGVLEGILGYPVHSGVSINYVPSLGDWKTAWDLIHFRGFLGVEMSMQFTWQGCDSILAAPLVLDLIRFAEFAHRHGESGPMRHVCSFFKSPIGVKEMALYPQFAQLLAYAAAHLQRREGLGKSHVVA